MELGNKSKDLSGSVIFLELGVPVFFRAFLQKCKANDGIHVVKNEGQKQKIPVACVVNDVLRKIPFLNEMFESFFN